jgi:hypothetical protein
MVASLLTNNYLDNSAWLLSYYMALVPILGFFAMLIAEKRRLKIQRYQPLQESY